MRRSIALTIMVCAFFSLGASKKYKRLNDDRTPVCQGSSHSSKMTTLASHAVEVGCEYEISHCSPTPNTECLSKLRETCNEFSSRVEAFTEQEINSTGWITQVILNRIGKFGLKKLDRFLDPVEEEILEDPNQPLLPQQKKHWWNHGKVKLEKLAKARAQEYIHQALNENKLSLEITLAQTGSIKQAIIKKWWLNLSTQKKRELLANAEFSSTYEKDSEFFRLTEDRDPDYPLPPGEDASLAKLFLEFVKADETQITKLIAHQKTKELIFQSKIQPLQWDQVLSMIGHLCQLYCIE